MIQPVHGLALRLKLSTAVDNFMVCHEPTQPCIQIKALRFTIFLFDAITQMSVRFSQ